MNELEKNILANPKFHTLVKRRSRFMWLLFALMLLIFFTYTFLLMFAPSLFGIAIWPGAATKIGIPFGMSVVIISFALTGVYVYRANAEFDEITKEILDEAGKQTDARG